LQHNCNTIRTPLQNYCSTTGTPPQHHYNTIAVWNIRQRLKFLQHTDTPKKLRVALFSFILCV
jgi:hypothetical protein